MGDSPKYRPRRSYAQPGEIDTSLLDADFRRSLAAAEPKPNRANSAPLTEIPEAEPASPPPNVPSSYSPQRLTPAPIAESRPSPPHPRVTQDPFYKVPAPARPVESKPSPPRSSVVQDPFYKPLAPAGNMEHRAPLRPAVESNPNRKSLAPPPGLIDGKPVAFSLGIDPALNRGNPALQRGLAPPPGIAATPSLPLRPVDIHAPLFERKPAPPPPPTRPQPELKPAIQNPQPLKLPTLSPLSSPLVRRCVSARFELLPDAEPRWNRMGLSAVGQLIILGLALLSPMFFPATMQTALKFDVIELMQPVTEIPVVPEAPKPLAPQPPPKPKPKPKPKVEPKAPELKPEVPEPPVLPQLNPRQPHVFLNLKPVVPKARAVQDKPLELKENLKQPEIVLSNGPKAPKEPNPGPGNPAPGTVNAALSKVQTGGFGDPNGIAGTGNPNRRGNINQAGSPGLPGGPGYGNGTGGAQGLRGTVASDGSGRSGGAGGAVSTGVAILYKPNPAYSAEGRERKIQGDVVLEVIFLASGHMKVTRVVSGLGFGLDDEAIQSAQRIRFTPAMRDGKPVDFPARVRIEFRLVE